MKLFASAALLPEGWQRNVLITLARNGDILTVQSRVNERLVAQSGAQILEGPVLPAMPNVHSSSYQRLVAGLLETAQAGKRQSRRRSEQQEPDSFWHWRERLYDFSQRLTPDLLHPLLCYVFSEMVRQGYSSVGEFHYLHHRPNGKPYDDSIAMAQAVLQAAQDVGIGLTLFMTLYQSSHFGGEPPLKAQKRFVNSHEQFLYFLGDINSRMSGLRDVSLGLGLHSLRAVPPKALNDAALAMTQHNTHSPIQILAAATQKEVEDCQEWSNKRPLTWLLDHAPLGPRWSIIHANQALIPEIKGLLDKQVTVGFCPTTEANMGFALFPAGQYLRRGGAGAIGSGACLSLSPFEELRSLEYGQRLSTGHHGVIQGLPEVTAGSSLGENLWQMGLAGGAKALHRKIKGIEAGHRANLLVLDGDHPELFDKTNDLLLDSLIFTSPQNALCDVMIGGRWVVKKGRHIKAEEIEQAYRKAIWSLLA